MHLPGSEKSPECAESVHLYAYPDWAVNTETGVAKENSLRRIRVVKKGLTLLQTVTG